MDHLVTVGSIKVEKYKSGMVVITLVTSQNDEENTKAYLNRTQVLNLALSLLQELNK